MSGCIIKAIEYYLPRGTLTNEQLAAQFPEWGVEKIAAKTGISTRHITAETELSSDLAFGAVTKLFESGVCRAEEIDFLLLCTQTPDHILPTTACLLQHRLGLPTREVDLGDALQDRPNQPRFRDLETSVPTTWR